MFFHSVLKCGPTWVKRSVELSKFSWSFMSCARAGKSFVPIDVLKASCISKIGDFVAFLKAKVSLST